MTKRQKDRIKSDRILTVYDTNGRKIIKDGKVTVYGQILNSLRTGESK